MLSPLSRLSPQVYPFSIQGAINCCERGDRVLAGEAGCNTDFERPRPSKMFVIVKQDGGWDPLLYSGDSTVSSVLHISFLCQQSIRILVYLDDFLLMAENRPQLLQKHLKLMMDLIQSLGFLLNKKNVLAGSLQGDKLPRLRCQLNTDDSSVATRQGLQDSEGMSSHAQLDLFLFGN